MLVPLCEGVGFRVVSNNNRADLFILFRVSFARPQCCFHLLCCLCQVSCILPPGARKFLIFLSVHSAVVLQFRGFNQSVRKGERLLDCALFFRSVKVCPSTLGHLSEVSTFVVVAAHQFVSGSSALSPLCLWHAGTRLVEIQEPYSHVGSIWRQIFQPKSYTNMPSLLEPTNKRRTTKG